MRPTCRKLRTFGMELPVCTCKEMVCVAVTFDVCVVSHFACTKYVVGINMYMYMCI